MLNDIRLGRAIMAQVQQAIFGLVTSAGLAAVSITPSARAEIIPAATMARGVQMTHAQCASQQLAVWVTVGRSGYCIRYYLSTAGGQGSTPVVHLSGDKLGRYIPKSEAFTETSAKDDIDT